MERFSVEKTIFPEVIVITPYLFEDHRGSFHKPYDENDFKALGILDRFIQDDYSWSYDNVLRGLHFQAHPRPVSKLVQCVAGKVFDVVVDIRPDSPTYKKWASFILSSSNRKIVYVPVGFAHGFYTMGHEGAGITYKMSDSFYPEHDVGIHWADPEISISWPCKDPILSEKDKNLPFIKDVETKLRWK